MQKTKKNLNWLFAGECKFIAGAATISAIPKLNLSEVAFAGRSNVGKSSLINAITSRIKLAKVSHTPGATRQINFFAVRDKLTIVDLPGHGYAKVSKTQIYNWSKLIIYYLTNRTNLKKLYLLIDSRRGIMDSDEMLMNILDNIGLLYNIVLTKCDKSSKTEIEKVKVDITGKIQSRPASHPEIYATSTRSSLGIEELKFSLMDYAK